MLYNLLFTNNYSNKYIHSRLVSLVAQTCLGAYLTNKRLYEHLHAKFKNNNQFA